MGSSTEKSILLVNGDPGRVVTLWRTRGKREGDLWLYLSQDMVRFQEIMERSGGGIPFAEAGKDLQEIARACRNRYVEYSASLQGPGEDPCRWVSSFSERNPFVSMVFPHFCRISLLLRMIRGPSRYIIAVCETRALMEAARDTLAGTPGISVELDDSPAGRLAEELLLGAGGVMKKAYFALRFTLRIALARLYGLAKGHRGGAQGGDRRAVVLSWIDRRTLAGGRELHDVYFGDLASRIRERGWEPCHVSQVLPTLSYPRALLHLFRLREDIYILEEFMRLRDVAMALSAIRRGLGEPFTVPPLEGVQLAPLVREEFARDRRAPARSEESALFFPAAARLAGRLQPGVLFYSFENHMWEKMFCAGARHADPGIRLIGYAHSVVAPMYLFYTLAEAEKGRVPLPDIICVNGPRAREVLLRNGFAGCRIEVTGALRYPGLPSGPRVRRRGPPWHVLLASSAGINETLELARKAAAAFPDPGEFRLVLKLHPALPSGKVAAHLRPYCPPVVLSEEPVARLLETSDLLLVMESASSVEALAAGVPVIHLGSDFRLDMNLFEGLSWVPSLSRPDEIRSMARVILEEGRLPQGMPPDPAGEFFAPVSGESLDRILADGTTPGCGG